MRLSLAVFCLVSALPRQDSVTDFKHVMSVLTVEQADSAVSMAIRSQGLKISKNTPFLIEANATGKPTFSGGKTQRLLSAVISVGDSTGVFLTGEELKYDRTGWLNDRRRVNDRDHGENGKFWLKVVAVANAIDSTARSAPPR